MNQSSYKAHDLALNLGKSKRKSNNSSKIKANSSIFDGFKQPSLQVPFSLSSITIRKEVHFLALALVFLFLYDRLPENPKVSSKKQIVEDISNHSSKIKVASFGFFVSKTKESTSKNEFAPANPRELRAFEIQDYVSRFSKVALEEQAKFGIPASISLAQGILESRSGNSLLAKKNNNHFGMKCFSRNCGKGHCTNHGDDHHKDFFRKFASPWESWRAHSKMITSGKYLKLKAYKNNYKKWAQGLQSLGYATDPNYSEKLIETIETYGLNKI
jgi:flagellum-specific peptidoglycan hydrolase FlgJ